MRGASGNFTGIVEDRDCTDEQRRVCEYNTGVMVADAAKLYAELRTLGNNNAQGEYYLTDIPGRFIERAYKIAAVASEYPEDIMGVSTVEDLAAAEAVLRKRGG
jgi:bifunctional UDP-N-acetylglucosamine pyrophosphorylase/glucosamine-1-phosphate N-acetyltransferase